MDHCHNVFLLVYFYLFKDQKMKEDEKDEREDTKFEHEKAEYVPFFLYCSIN